MKQFLRHIFLFVAIFVATTNAWAAWTGSGEAVKYENGTYYVVYQDSYETLNTIETGPKITLSGPGEKLSYTARRTGSNYFYYSYSTNGGSSWTDKSESLTTSDATYTATLDNNVNAIRFLTKTGATLRKYISNVRVTMAQYIENPSKTTIEFGSGKVDDTNSVGSFTIPWCNVPAMTYTIEGSGSDCINISVANNSEPGKYNTATFTITYDRTKASNLNATLTIKNSYGSYSKEIKIIGSTAKYDQTLSWNNESAIETNMQLGKTQTVTATATSGLAVTYSSSDNRVLTVDASGKITAVGIGNATITASQTGNYKYNAAVPSITKSYTVWNKNTPIFTPNGFNEANVCHLKVGDKVTLEVLNVSDGLSGDFKVNTDNNILGITRNGNTITIEALNAGTADAIFTQTENHDIFGAEKKYQFSVSKINNTLAIASSSYTKYVDDEITNIISSINSDAAITTSSSDATIAYYDVTSDKIFIPNSEAKSFSSKTITITVEQAETYKYTAAKQTITLTVNKYDISAFIIQNSAYLNALINNAFSLSYGLDGYSVTSLNLGIAEYVAGNKIQTYFTEGTAQFRVTREEDYKYKGLNKTLTLNVVKAAGGCLVLEPCSGDYYAAGGGDFTPSALTGPGSQLTFDARSGNSTRVGDVEIQEYVNGWNTIATIDPGTDTKTYGPYDLSELATQVRFYTGAGSYRRYFENVQVTRKTYLRPTVNPLALPQATIGRPISASFDLSWSTCSDEVVLVSTNSNFVLSQYSIDATSGRGTTTITVTYDANSGSQSGTIIIYDQSQKIEIPVSCEVTAKLATKIIYTGNATYPDTPEGIPYPFYVEDKNGNTVQGAKITLKTSNEDILSVDSTKIYPHCGGYVTLTATYAGDETHEPASKEQQIFVLECYQHIVWDQNFKTYLATEEGYIDETTLLTAYAVTADGIPTENPIQYTLDEKADSIADIQYNGDGTYSLYVHGVGKGHIIARATACTFEGEQYVAAESMHELRVKRVGEKCESVESVVSDEFSLSGLLFWEDKEKICELEGRPYSSLEFYSHVNNDSYDNHISVSFSTDNQATWTDATRYENISNVYNWYVPFVCNSIPDGATHVKFRAESTRNTYINMVSAAQRSYFEVDQTAIEITDAKVNVPFTRQLVLSFSDVPLVHYHVTNSHDLDLTLTPDRPVDNDCGDWGTYTFTLRGESPYPQQAVQETITLSTSSGEQVEIPVTITATLSDPFYFNQQAGDWSVSTHWTYQGNTNHGLLPDKAHPVVISKALTIGNDITKSELVAYSVKIENGGSVEIKENGGLTVHAGGFEEVNENNLTIHSDTLGAGFVRVSPFFTTQVPGTMPNAKVNFTTKANMNAGDNRDAAWQYIGAPGSGVGMDLAHTTVLYLRSEEKGWVRQYTEWAQLTPFAGYALTQKEQKTFTLYPQLLNENVTIPLTYTSNGMKGDNLWANSYMAPLDITKFTDADFTGDIDKTFYLYNSGSWNQWNEDKGAINSAEVQPGRYYAIPVASARALDATYDQNVVPPMQGVYMKANSGGGTITLNYEKHVWNNTQTAQMNQPLRVAGRRDSNESQSVDFQRVRLQVNSENSGADRMYIIQDSMATASYDNGYDAPKLMADGLVNIYTNEPFGKMEISSTDHMDGMFIGFQAGEDTHYIMTFTSLVGDSLYLYDLEEDKFVEMLDGEQYHFSAIAQSTNDMRFQVLVAPTLPDETPGQGGGVTTDVENITTPQLWISDRKVFVSNAKPNSTMAIYTASGMLVTAPYTLHTTPYTLDLSYLPTGVYVLRLNDQAYKFVCK